MFARRRAMAGLTLDKTNYPNGSLWISRFPEELDPAQPEKRNQVFKDMERVPPPEHYSMHFKRWQQALASHSALCGDAESEPLFSRLAVGLGNDSVLETSITLHHTYGVPFIPGSALKGLCSSYAANRLDDDSWNRHGESHSFLFGDEENSGSVMFYDALPYPGFKILRDVLNVHHSGYYQNAGPDRPAPADWDDPKPISFLTSTGKFLIAVKAEDPLWSESALTILRLALEQEGVGGKTSRGYGRLKMAAPAPPAVRKSADFDWISRLSPKDKGSLKDKVSSALQNATREERSRAFELLETKLNALKWADVLTKDWYIRLRDSEH
jgi:CRISPR-associated protein Cmr6